MLRGNTRNEGPTWFCAVGGTLLRITDTDPSRSLSPRDLQEFIDSFAPAAASDLAELSSR